MRGFFYLLASLKFTVFVLLALVAEWGSGIALEFFYDRMTARYYVYDSRIFHALLALLAINMLAGIVCRFPWKLRHVPFLLVQIGVLILLTGLFVTERYGIEGKMTLNERETSDRLDLGGGELFITSPPGNPSHAKQVLIPWTPPWVSFRKISLPDDLTVDRYLTHAELRYSFIPGSKESKSAALKLRLEGGFNQISHEFWLYSGDSHAQKLDLGLAEFVLGSLSNVPGKPSFSAIPEADGGLSYIARSSDGKIIRGKLGPNEIQGKLLALGWKGGTRLALLDYLPQAQMTSTYQASGMDHGEDAPASAIHIIETKEGPAANTAADHDTGTWLALGARTDIKVGGQTLELDYFPQGVRLPFALRLDQIAIPHFHGAHGPEYSAQVTVVDPIHPKRVALALNQSFVESGYTIRQASFGGTKPWPTSSTLKFSFDPGRMLKYLGLLLAILGGALFFAARTTQSTKFRGKSTSP